MKDFYYILGVGPNCTLTEIKEAYWKLSKKFHPDLNQGDDYFQGRFREINEAYETLIDPDRRFQYDTALKKFKSNTTDEKGGTQYYAANPQYQTRPSSFKKSRLRGPGVGMSIALILIALILGI